MMLLAQAQTTGTGGILTPFVIIFGWIIRAIYSGLATMGIYNVGKHPPVGLEPYFS